MAFPGAEELVVATVTGWEGVAVAEGSRGETSIRLGKRELGHLHGDRVLHIGFRKDVWQELYDAGRVEYHPIFPGKKGWAQRRIDSAHDVEDAVALLRLNYVRAIASRGEPATA